MGGSCIIRSEMAFSSDMQSSLAQQGPGQGNPAPAPQATGVASKSIRGYWAAASLNSGKPILQGVFHRAGRFLRSGAGAGDLLPDAELHQLLRGEVGVLDVEIGGQNVLGLQVVLGAELAPVLDLIDHVEDVAHVRLLVA